MVVCKQSSFKHIASFTEADVNLPEKLICGVILNSPAVSNFMVLSQKSRGDSVDVP